MHNNNIIVCLRPNDKLKKTLGNHYETQEVDCIIADFVKKIKLLLR